MINFEDPNLIDIEITSHIKGKLGLTMGIGITQGVTLISSIPMSIKVFEKHLPESALASHINSGGVVLKPILKNAEGVTIVEKPSTVDPDNNPFGAEFSTPGDITTPPVATLDDGNPFTGVTPEEGTVVSPKPNHNTNFNKKK